MFRAGEQAYKAGQYDVAAEAFEHAYEALPLPAIAFSAAQAYRLQYFIDKDPRRLKRAIELYRTYLDDVKQGGRRDDAATNLAELEPILSREQATRSKPIEGMGAANGAQTRIMVSSNVSEAKASLEGGELTAVPLVRAVEPGQHEVKVVADGYFPVEQEYAVVEGQFRVVEVVLQPKPARVRLRTIEGAQVTVDGRLIGTTPLPRPLELASGAHFITVTHRGRTAWSREIEVARGAEVELTASLRRTTQRKVAYGVLGTSAAFVLAGGLAGLAALGADSDASELESQRTSTGLTADELARRDQLIADRDNAATVSLALFGVGAGMAIAGGLLYFLDTPRPSEQRTEIPATRPNADPYQGMRPVKVTPIVSPGIAGVALSGRF
jgi:tetratricopeptide (TPR) repeat protein